MSGIGTGGDFVATEATAARNVGDAADAAGLRRIVYLGGMGNGDGLLGRVGADPASRWAKR
jgi:hypothetical protein